MNNATTFHHVEGQLPLEEKVTLEYLRDQKTRQVSLTVEPLAALDGADIDRRLSGARFEELPLKMRSERIRGILIAELERDSRLARQGFRRGDVITGINRQPVQNLAEFTKEVEQTRGAFVIQILRDGETYLARID